MARVREPVRKNNRLAYIAAGSAIGLGLAGAAVAYDRGIDPVGGFVAGVKHWGGEIHQAGRLIADRYVDSLKAPMGVNVGPNPLAQATGFCNKATDVYVKPFVGLAERPLRRGSDHLRGPDWGELGLRTGRG